MSAFDPKRTFAKTASVAAKRVANSPPHDQQTTARNLQQAKLSKRHPAGEESFCCRMPLPSSVFEQRPDFSTHLGGFGFQVANPSEPEKRWREIRRDTVVQDYLAIILAADFSKEPGISYRSHPRPSADRAMIIFQR